MGPLNESSLFCCRRWVVGAKAFGAMPISAIVPMNHEQEGPRLLHGLLRYQPTALFVQNMCVLAQVGLSTAPRDSVFKQFPCPG